MQKSGHFLSAGLCCLASWASLTELLNIPANSWPPVISLDVLCRLLGAKVAQYCMREVDYDLRHPSFPVDDGWYAQHVCSRSIAGVNVVID